MTFASRQLLILGTDISPMSISTEKPDMLKTQGAKIRECFGKLKRPNVGGPSTNVHDQKEAIETAPTYLAP